MVVQIREERPNLTTWERAAERGGALTKAGESGGVRGERVYVARPQRQPEITRSNNITELPVLLGCEEGRGPGHIGCQSGAGIHEIVIPPSSLASQSPLLARLSPVVGRLLIARPRRPPDRPRVGWARHRL